MAKPSSHRLDLAKRGAVVRFHELVEELHLLLTAFPDLHDAYDAEDLPITFILKRGSRRAATAAVRQETRGKSAGSATVAGRRRPKTAARARRPGEK